MKTIGIIEGLSILQRYRTGQFGYDVSAEHDVIYAHKTDRPVGPDDLKRLVQLGWFQEDADYPDGEFGVEHYAPDESWTCYV